MTKQQEIKNGVEKFISEAYWYEGRGDIVTSITNRLWEYLHDNGMVLKVESHLSILTEHGTQIANLIKKAGYEATEPLIHTEQSIEGE